MTRAIKRPSRAERTASKMSHARAKVRPGSRSTDYYTGLARTKALPALPPVPKGMTLDKWAVSVSTAAKLLGGVAHQGVQSQITRGTLPAYQHNGRRLVLLSDLREHPTTQRQAAVQDVLDQRRADHDDRVAHPWPGVAMECVGKFVSCTLCGPPTDAYEKLGDEPVGKRPTRPFSAKRNAHLASMHAVTLPKLAAANERRRLAKVDELARLAAEFPTETVDD